MEAGRTKVIAAVRYRCKTCGSIEAQHTRNRLNADCCSCGCALELLNVLNIYTKELGEPWIEEDDIESLKELIFKMLPTPP